MSRLFVAPRTLGALVAMLVVWHSAIASAQTATGEANFKKICAACHTIGGGRLVGPDLMGVNERRSPEWLLKFIASSQTVVQSGEPTAVALFKEFNMVMPDAPYSAAEITEILAFIGSKSGSQDVAVATTARAATPEEIRTGQQLFEGTIRLTNGGAPCNSCHHVANDAVIGGGILAKELTTVFSRLGGPGIHAILGSPPFPVMEQAFKDRPLTEEEIVALVGFLQDADQHHAFQQPRDFGFKLFYSGFAGLVPLVGLYAFVWRRRKTRPVNYQVFERQVHTRDDRAS
jgi:hypothetical protein